MTGPHISGYAALQQGAELTRFTYNALPLKQNEVRIAISHCGICGSDIQGIDNVYGIVTYPFVPGHEVVGQISEVGAAVPPGRLGERVGVGWQGRACRQCDWCLQGDVHLCQDVAVNGSWTPYGGFSSSIIVEESFAYPIPKTMPSEVAAVMMCAGFTVYNFLHKYRTTTGLKLAIVGIGGLGHLAIQFAKEMGYEVTAISSSPGKYEQAMAFGADQFLAITNRDAIRRSAYYFDLLYITAHGGIEWEYLLSILKKKGVMAISGFPQVNFDSVDLVAHELSIVGSFLGTQVDMHSMLHFAQASRIQPMIEIMPMSQVNQAIQRVKQNLARYRIVLLNDIM